MKEFKTGKRPAKPGVSKERNFRSDKPKVGRPFTSGPFPAICAACGASCEVPFKPNGLKEVFCNNCFNTGGLKPLRNSGKNPKFKSPREFNNAPSGSNQYSKSQLDHIEAKLDKILALLIDQ